MSFIGSSLSSHVMWRFRFGKDPSESPGAIVFLFQECSQTSVFGTLA
jgi:hypothetical protein